MAKISCFYKCGATNLTSKNIEDHYQKHHSKLKAYPRQEFTCDGCQKYFDSSLLYSVAPNQEELANWYHYCANCTRPKPQPSFSPLKPKNMKKTSKKSIKKTKTKKSYLKPKKTKSKLKPKRSLKTKKSKSTALTLKPSFNQKTKNTPAYYNCLLNQAKSGFKGKITKACQECRTKAPALNLDYKKEAQNLVQAYRDLGVSLSKILSH